MTGYYKKLVAWNQIKMNKSVRYIEETITAEIFPNCISL